MAQPVPGEQPRVSLALQCVQVAFDLSPAEAPVESVTELIGVNVPGSTGHSTQNKRPARGITLGNEEVRERGSQGQVQRLSKNLLQGFGGERPLPSGVAAREAIGIVNRNQVGLGAVGPHSSRRLPSFPRSTP